MGSKPPISTNFLGHEDPDLSDAGRNPKTVVSQPFLQFKRQHILKAVGFHHELTAAGYPNKGWQANYNAALGRIQGRSGSVVGFRFPR